MIVFPNNSIVAQLLAVVVNVFDGLVDCRLYQNPAVLTGDTVLGDLTEATFGGYAAVSPAGWGVTHLIDVMTAQCKQTPVTFTADGTGPPNDIYGAYFNTGGVLLAVMEFPAGPIHIDTLGQTVNVALDLLLGPRGEAV